MHYQQKLLSKQSQLVDQNFSNGIMLNALSALENLAIFSGYKGKTIFGYYSGYAHRNNEKELVNAVILQLEIFRASHSNYSLVYSDYDFPKNLTREEIIKYVKDWKKAVPKDLQVFYKEILNYLQGNSNYSGISDILDKKRKEFGPTTEEDLSRIARSAPYINTNMHKQYEQVKNSYDKTGSYDIRAHLNENPEDNIDMRDLNNYDQKLEEQNKHFKILEKKIESFFTNVVYTSSIKENDFNELKENVEIFQNCVIEMNLGENEIMKKIKLYRSYKENIQKVLTGIVNSNVIALLVDICDRMIIYYSKRNPNSIA